MRGPTDRTWLRRSLAVAVAGLTAVALWTAVRADQPQGDAAQATSGLQNTVSLTAASGVAVATSVQLVIERKGGHHLAAGDQVTFDVDASATTLPDGYSVGSVTLTVPTPWDTSGQTVAGSLAITFTAPSTPGSYQYTVQWTASGAPCVTTPPFCLTGTPVYTIDLTVDATPPALTPSVSGTLGDNGWYTSDVAVTWSVSDPESGVASSTGCGPTTITADTTGTQLTCAATNGVGLAASETVTVRRDATPPQITIAAPTNGSAFTQGQTVVAEYTCTDATAGVASCAGPVADGAAIDTASEGTRTFTVSATDAAGNTAAHSCTYTVTAAPVRSTPAHRAWDPSCPIDGRPRDPVCLPLHHDPKLQSWQRSLGCARWIEEGGTGTLAGWKRPLTPAELAMTGMLPGATIGQLFEATWGGLAA